MKESLGRILVVLGGLIAFFPVLLIASWSLLDYLMNTTTWMDGGKNGVFIMLIFFTFPIGFLISFFGSQMNKKLDDLPYKVESKKVSRAKNVLVFSLVLLFLGYISDLPLMLIGLLSSILSYIWYKTELKKSKTNSDSLTDLSNKSSNIVP